MNHYFFFSVEMENQSTFAFLSDALLATMIFFLYYLKKQFKNSKGFLTVRSHIFK